MDPEVLAWGLGMSMGVFVGLAFAIAIYIIEICNMPGKKMQRKLAQRKKVAEKERIFLKSINLDGMKIVQFEEMYEKRLKKDFLYNEFNALLSRYMQKNPSKIAASSKNGKKNVFTHHIPFEGNIVELNPPKRYINASWIDGFECEKKYIITQVPLEVTINDFWTMIWQFNCSIIVMLGQEITYDKFVVNYLKPQVYKSWKNPFQIEIEKKKEFSDFLMRTLVLRNKKASRRITHLQFQTWNHLTVTNAQVILEVRRQMKMLWNYNRDDTSANGPIVVHCISGCGRSGTFVAICNLCDRIDSLKESKKDEKISIAYEVINMREGRMFSVANLHQYSMIYETIVHYIVGGITAININDLEEEMSFLSIRSPVSGLTRFQHQYANANRRTRKLILIDCSGGRRAENDKKNRIFNIVPRDFDRPYLKNLCLVDSSDYINAVYVDSFNSKCHFIVTQWPLKHTINDIWRLFFDKRINAAVLLNAMECNKTYPMFWPNIQNQSVGCGTISVKLIRDYFQNPSIRCQIFELKKIQFRLKNSELCQLKANNITLKPMPESDSWEIVLFHLVDWAEGAMPDNLENVIELIRGVEDYNYEKWNRDKATKSPIAIISKDGVERAGVFCVVSHCLKSIKASAEIDVYSSVLNVKRNRPELIPTIDEYLLCYELCLECVNSSSKTAFQIDEDAVDDTNYVDE